MQRKIAIGVAVVLAGAVIPAAASATRQDRSGAGCSATPATVAYHPGGRLLRPQPRRLPAACGVLTGYPGAESHLVIRPDGTVVYTPAVLPSGTLGIGSLPGDNNGHTQSNASPAGLAVTSDRGAHWHVVKPSGVTWNPTDHGDYVDPATGRLFYEDYGPIPVAPQFGADQEGPAHMNWSDDLKHWHHTVITGLTLPENPRYTSGRAPHGQLRPHGYPNVIYFCVNTNVGFVSPVIAGRLCYRSLDGGSSWQRRSVLFTGAAPQHRECGANGEIYSAIDGYYPQAAPDGTLYVMVACGGKTYLARSTDEAASFPILRGQSAALTLPVPASGIGIGGTPELRILSDGTFALVYQQGNKLMLRLSRTRGITWTQPMDITAPGVTGINQWALATHGADDLAVAFLGQRRGQATWDAYLTASHDVTAGLRSVHAPVFVSGQLNAKGKPMLYGNTVKGSGYLEGPAGTSLPYPPPFNQQQAGNDFIGAAIAPDGTPWGSFNQDCGPAPDAAGCRQRHDQTRGFAGHL